eukprot:574062-Pelagomonas_calceolata.AAC.4
MEPKNLRSKTSSSVLCACQSILSVGTYRRRGACVRVAHHEADRPKVLCFKSLSLHVWLAHAGGGACVCVAQHEADRPKLLCSKISSLHVWLAHVGGRACAWVVHYEAVRTKILCSKTLSLHV